MYYSATGTGYISTPSFAIPNTGIMTIETWMKSKVNAVTDQTIVGDALGSNTLGFILAFRAASTNTLGYYYANGASQVSYGFSSFFLNFDDQ